MKFFSKKQSKKIKFQINVEVEVKLRTSDTYSEVVSIFDEYYN